MRYFGLIAVLSTVVMPQMSHAQAAAPRAAPTFTLPASLADRKLSDSILQATGGNIDAIFSRVSGDSTELTSTTQGVVFSLPSSLAEVVTKATQASSVESASAMGLGLCMATSSLMNVANDPATTEAESRSARDFARAILTSVANAQTTGAAQNGGISSSFGISTNSSGGAAITCKSISGEIVATTAVNASPATSNAGVGIAINQDAASAVGAAGADGVTGGGGSLNKVVFPSFATASFSAPALSRASSTTVVAVPGPDAGVGVIPLLALAGLFAKKRQAIRNVRGRLRLIAQRFA